MSRPGLGKLVIHCRVSFFNVEHMVEVRAIILHEANDVTLEHAVDILADFRWDNPKLNLVGQWGRTDDL